MTDLERTRILDLRALGMRYTQIAGELGLSVNTIKSFCRRADEVNHARAVVINEKNSYCCKQCGADIAHRDGMKTKPKEFCCDRCRNRWWNAHRSSLNQQVRYTATCSGCGEAFTSAYKDRKYCCHACYIKDRFKKGEQPCQAKT